MLCWLHLAQHVSILLPAFNETNFRWEQTWNITPKTEDEISSFWNELRQIAEHSAQARLDDFAKTRGYEGIVSACTYATSTIEQFKAEGQYCVEARDSTWAALYQVFNDVDTGAIEMPASYEQIAMRLPQLQWPT